MAGRRVVFHLPLLGYAAEPVTRVVRFTGRPAGPGDGEVCGLGGVAGQRNGPSYAAREFSLRPNRRSRLARVAW